MAGPVPPYITTQQAAQTAFTVPFGLLAFVNGKISTASAAGEFNTTVDCSLFVTEDVSNLRIYLDSLGYLVEFAKNTNEKSLNIDWGRFRDVPGTAVTVFQGTTPWVISGTVDQGAAGVDPWPVTISSFPGSISVTQGTTPWTVDGTVDVGNFPAIQQVSGTVITNQGTSPWTVDGTVNVGNFPAVQPISGTVTANQGTSPWVVSGTITTSPDVNIHDSVGNNLNSTSGSLDVNVTNFPATVAVTQSTSPWVVSGSVAVTNFPAIQPVSGTVTSLQGTSPWIVGGTVAATQSGAWTTGRTWALASGTDSVAAVQSGPWTVEQGTPPWSVSVTNFPAVQPISGTVTANQGTSPWIINGTVAATQSGAWTTGRTWALASGTDSVASVQSGAWTTGRTWALSNGTDSVAAVQSGGWTVSGTGNFTVVQPTGTNLHTVLDSGTLTSITNALPAGTNVIGHVITDSGSTTVVTGNVTVVQPTGTNLHAVVDSGSITVNNAAGASAVNIQDGGNTITVDGTVTANQGTPAATANRWPVQITDGTDLMIVDPDGSIYAKPVPVGTHGNAWNAATVSSGNNSAVIDLQYCRTVSIFGNSSNNLNPMRVQVSQDNVNYFTLTTFAITAGNFGVTIDLGARYLRLQSGQGAGFTVTATVAGK